MSQQPASGDVVFIRDNGDRVQPGEALVNGRTYFAELAGAGGPWGSVQWKWDAAIIITAITLESCNFGDRRQDGEAVGDFWGGVDSWEPAAVGWQLEPAAAYTTVTAAGGTAATNLQHLGGNGARRLRCKIVVGVTGGKLRGRYHHKS